MTWKNGEYQPQQKRADVKKQKLIDAAAALFGEVGYHGTNAKAIAARAGVATGSFYRYFRDKKALFMAVCYRNEEEIGQRIFRYADDMRRKGMDEPAILKELVVFSIEAHHRHPALHREILAMEIRDTDVAAWSRERESRIVEALYRFLSLRRSDYRISDLEAAAELIFYVIEEVAHRSVLFESPVGEERLTNQLTDMLNRYLFEI